MSNLISALLIAVVQGLTEWIPVSSSGHLVFVAHLLNYPATLTFIVALHFGTLMAAFVYFGKDITDIIEDLLKGKWKTKNGRLGITLIIATIPAAIFGLIFYKYFQETVTSLTITALGFGITGLFLIISSLNIRFYKKKNLEKMNFKESLIIGFSQVVSLIPGISRSGATIGSGVLLGFDEKDAVKFSFLLSIPIVFGASLVSINGQTFQTDMIWATLVSFIVGLLMIHVLYKYVLVNRKNLKWFGLYALLIALGITIYLFII